MSGTETFPTALWLTAPALLRIPPAALALVAAALVATGLLLRYTWIGLDLKAVGCNPGAAFLYGLKPSRLMLLAMLFAGGLTGMMLKNPEELYRTLRNSGHQTKLNSGNVLPKTRFISVPQLSRSRFIG
ncbi:MAG: hypothetical protein HGA72_02145 [Chlorobiaceae bacterium]|nr:hypothetical protein [Chlorobiaceae bacterium]